MDWKKAIKFGYDKVLGLDIGSSSVKMLQVRKDVSGYVVTAASIAEIETAGESNANIRDMDTVNAITKCMELTNLQNRNEVCGVCGRDVAVRYFKFPSLSKEEIPGAVSLEASQICPFDIEDGAADYQLMPDTDDCVCGVLVAATNKVMKRKIQLAKNSFLECVLMDVDGLALLNCLSEYEKSSSTDTAVLNVGSSVTSLAIANQDNLPFVRDIAYAGEDIIKQFTVEKNIAPEKARDNLYGSNVKEELQVELSSNLKKACRKLISEVNDTLRYYTTQEKKGKIKRVLVCGGFALVEDFVELLSHNLNAEVVLWNPFDRIPCDGDQYCKETLEKSGPALAVAAGLAMRSI